jgi:hypothetical protein
VVKRHFHKLFHAYTNTQPDFVEFDNETKCENLDDSDYHSDTLYYNVKKQSWINLADCLTQSCRTELNESVIKLLSLKSVIMKKEKLGKETFDNILDNITF